MRFIAAELQGAFLDTISNATRSRLNANMSTQMPLRIARSPAHSVRRQCLFQRRSTPSTPRCLAATPARAFSSTPARPRKKENRIVDTRMQMAGAASTIFSQPSPNVQNSRQDVQEMAEDIGLLQNTIIRAPFGKLPSPTSWEFYAYFWTVLKSRATALYTRSHFKRCVHKQGIASYLPVDMWKQATLKNKAKKMYKRYYDALAAYVSLPVPYLSYVPPLTSLIIWRRRCTNAIPAAMPNACARSASPL